MTRREAILSALGIFVVALVVRVIAATYLTFPRPEDVAYYVGVARNLVELRGLTTDAIWSFGTPPLVFPRPAFEVWLPLPSFLAAFSMAFAGHTFAGAQWSSIVVGSLVPVLAWRLGADVADERALPLGRARTLAIGAGLTTAVFLPLVLHSVQPDSTMPFAVLTLVACLLMARLVRGLGVGVRVADVRLTALGVVLGLAALTRNEAIWLALTWAWVAWRGARRFPGGSRVLTWLGLVAVPALVSIAVFVPWAIRDWDVFGTPFPGQALSNALSLDGRDIFAWQDPPTVARYLAAGPLTLLGLRWTGLVHNVVNVLLLLGIPVSLIGLLALPWSVRTPRDVSVLARARAGVVSPALWPLVLVSAVTFVVTTLVFPVSTTWGTFLHAAGAIHVLLILSALLALDRLIAAVGLRRGWTRPVAWLGPALTISASVLFVAALLPAEGRAGQATAARFDALPARLARAGVEVVPRSAPVITDTPIWMAEELGWRALALPNEAPSSVLDLARRFGAEVVVLDAANEGIWPEVLAEGGPGSECFVRLDLGTAMGGGAGGGAAAGTDAGGREEAPDFVAYRIGCP